MGFRSAPILSINQFQMSEADYITLVSRGGGVSEQRIPPSGYWFNPGLPTFDQGLGTTAMTNTRLFYVPFIITKSVQVQGIGVSVSVAAALSHLTVAIYANGANNWPSTRLQLFTGGSGIDTTATGRRNITGLNFTLSPGMYWFGLIEDTAGVSLNAYTASTNGDSPAAGTTSAITQANCYYIDAQPVGTANDPAPTPPSNANAGIPRVLLQVA